MVADKDISKELHHCANVQMAATLTLAETQLLSSGMPREDARKCVEESMEYWRNLHTDELGRPLDW